MAAEVRRDERGVVVTEEEWFARKELVELARKGDRTGAEAVLERFPALRVWFEEVWAKDHGRPRAGKRWEHADGRRWFEEKSGRIVVVRKGEELRRPWFGALPEGAVLVEKPSVGEVLQGIEETYQARKLGVVEPEMEAEEWEPEAEEEEVEDGENPANNLLRKLWRFSEALGWLKPKETWAERVGPALWWMCRDDRETGEEVWVKWLGKDARERWRQGFEGQRGWSVGAIYREAQRAGWRYPVVVNLNQLHQMARQTEMALVRAGAEIYQNGGKLIRPIKIKVAATKGRTVETAVLHEISGNYLRSMPTDHIYFLKPKGDKLIGGGMPHELAGAILSRVGDWTFPTIVGVVAAQTLRRDGSVLAQPGYDLATQLFVMGPLPEMPAIPRVVERDDALRAIAVLKKEVLAEFEFCDGPSCSVALSGIITLNVRAGMTCVPAHLASAPKSGNGKSFLWDCAAAIATGDAMPICSAGKNQDDCQKNVATELMKDLNVLSIDNMQIVLGGDVLCQIIERPSVTFRFMRTNTSKDDATLGRCSRPAITWDWTMTSPGGCCCR
jgi:hypothetical protein